MVGSYTPNISRQANQYDARPIGNNKNRRQDEVRKIEEPRNTRWYEIKI